MGGGWVGGWGDLILAMTGFWEHLAPQPLPKQVKQGASGSMTKHLALNSLVRGMCCKS